MYFNTDAGLSKYLFPYKQILIPGKINDKPWKDAMHRKENILCIGSIFY
jgi:hypothetical protein